MNADPEQTTKLLDRCRDGDSAAIEELLSLHRDYLHLVIDLRMDPNLAGRIDTSDVIQETHIEAVRRLEDYLQRQPMPFRIWLRQTAIECLLQQRRKHVDTKGRSVKREVALPDRSSVMLGGLALAVDKTPSAHFAEEEMARRVREAVAKLPDIDREILLMRNFEALTNQETALALEIDADAARKRYTRALRRLRDILTEDGLSESQI